jgi:hypothetical protein
MKGRYSDATQSYVAVDTLIDVTDDDIEKFIDGGYNGDIFKIYNYALILGQGSNSYSSLLEETRISDVNNMREFFVRQTYGTIVCDEEYMLETYGKNGVVNYLGNPNDKPYGLIITDFVADSIIYFNPTIYTSREDIIGNYVYSSASAYRGYVNAIIDTDYEEKYGLLKEKVIYEYETLVKHNKQSQVIKTSTFLNFAKEVRHYLGMTYTTNKYWYLDSTSYESRNFVRLDYTTIESELLEKDYYLSTYSAYPDVVANSVFEISLEKGECALKATEYNKIFGTEYKNTNLDEFQPHKITINRYPKTRNAFTDPRVSVELTITKLLPSSSSYNLLLSEEDFGSLRMADTFCFGLLFENLGDADKLYNITSENPFTVDSTTFNGITRVFMIISIFKDFFLIITVGLCLVAVLLLMSFAAGNLRKRKFEIGVIKAMGGRTSELS